MCINTFRWGKWERETDCIIDKNFQHNHYVSETNETIVISYLCIFYECIQMNSSTRHVYSKKRQKYSNHVIQQRCRNLFFEIISLVACCFTNALLYFTLLHGFKLWWWIVLSRIKLHACHPSHIHTLLCACMVLVFTLEKTWNTKLGKYVVVYVLCAHSA